MEKKILPYLVILSALSVSLSAAFYSVFGIGKLFSGASMQVMIMMGSLELAKLVLASFLYQYWDNLNRLLKTYYFIAVFTLMVITSAGIYGYLSSAYAETANKLENVDKKVGVIDLKRNLFWTQLEEIRAEKNSINQNISDLTKALSNNVIQYTDRTGQMVTTTSSANRKAFESQLTSAQLRRDEVVKREIMLNDSITSLDLQKLDLETNGDVASELGPLKYIAKITEKPIDQVVNWFILALMLVFDPLAVSLVVGANVIFKVRSKEREKEKKLENIDEKLKKFDDRELEIKTLSEEFESRSKEFSEIESKLKLREEETQKSIQNRLRELDEKIQLEESRLNERGDQINSEKERISNFEEVLKKRELEIEEKLNLEKSKLSEIESREQSISQKDIEIQKERETLKEEWDNIQLELAKIESKKEELNSELGSISSAKAEIEDREKEIQKWESMHWKLKRRKPNS